VLTTCSNAFLQHVGTGAYPRSEPVLTSATHLYMQLLFPSGLGLDGSGGRFFAGQHLSVWAQGRNLSWEQNIMVLWWQVTRLTTTPLALPFQGLFCSTQSAAGAVVAKDFPILPLPHSMPFSYLACHSLSLYPPSLPPPSLPPLPGTSWA
jgi:hypothetical protein